MASEERNALAELADWLECQEDCFPVLANQFLWQDEQDIENIKKIRRIIAELAKVDATYEADMVHNNICLLAYDAFEKCRAIAAAEEGAKNES